MAACCRGNGSGASASLPGGHDHGPAASSSTASPRAGAYTHTSTPQTPASSHSPSCSTPTSMPPPSKLPPSATASPASSSSLPVRSACEACRDRKLKCDGVKGPGGCGRCRSDGVPCVYTSRKPIGRPKKRRTDDGTLDAAPRPTKMRAPKPEPYDGASSSSIDSPAMSLVQSPSAMVASPGQDSYAWPPHLASSHWQPPPRSMLVAPPPAPPPTADDSPTLSDLSVAAFLNSLDTLEIGHDDGLTPGMLSQWPGAASASHQAPASNAVPSNNALSLSGAALHDGSSFAVPSDFGWWNPGFLVDFEARAPGERVESGVGGNVDSGGAGQPPASAPGALSPVLAEPAAKSCCCSSKAASDAAPAPQPSQPAPLHLAPEQQPSSSPPSSRIHCVPNPSGKGCTCLCDVSVALINVRGRLKHAVKDNKDDETAATLQLTLSASQAVAAQCACSADCPTCRSDPSTAVTSASLLVSTALQIYARAVDTLRKSFVGGGSGGGGGASSSSSGGDAANTWSIRIGDYKPSARNARRIALLAIGLELRDLSDALQKVRRAAQAGSALRLGDERGTSPGPADEGSGSGSGKSEDKGDSHAPPMPPLLTAIDHLVIKKLHQQVEEMLHTIEALEGGAKDRDMERERERQRERERERQAQRA